MPSAGSPRGRGGHWRVGPEVRDVTAAEVLANIDALVWGVAGVEPGGTIELDILLELHRRLLAGTRLEEHGGRLRTTQNWIGGSGHNPGSAAFVPPPPEDVSGLLDDLLAFCNEDGLPALAQAAIAHAQFETIHPFVDGNGRVGRALIHLTLRRRGIAVRFLPPVSLVLATWADDYVAGLTATRYAGEPGSAVAHAGVNRWTALFASACRRAVADAEWFEGRVCRLQDTWRQRAGQPRRDSAGLTGPLKRRSWSICSRRWNSGWPARPAIRWSAEPTLRVPERRR